LDEKQKIFSHWLQLGQWRQRHLDQDHPALTCPLWKDQNHKHQHSELFALDCHSSAAVPNSFAGNIGPALEPWSCCASLRFPPVSDHWLCNSAPGGSRLRQRCHAPDNIGLSSFAGTKDGAIIGNISAVVELHAPTHAQRTSIWFTWGGQILA
jgi:hypothetical protein